MFDHSIYKWFYATAIAMILAVVVLFVQLSTDPAHSPQPVAVVVIVLIAAIFGFIITGCLSIQRLLDTHPKLGAHIKYPPGAPASTAEACAQADTRARETYQALASGRGLPTQGSPTIPLQADEAIYGIFHIQHARLYGTQETYQHHQYLGVLTGDIDRRRGVPPTSHGAGAECLSARSLAS